MIPTPAKRHNVASSRATRDDFLAVSPPLSRCAETDNDSDMSQLGDEDDEEEEARRQQQQQHSDETTNGFQADLEDCEDDDEPQVLEDEEDEEDLEYMRLDTIVEEDEHQSDTLSCDMLLRHQQIRSATPAKRAASLRNQEAAAPELRNNDDHRQASGTKLSSSNAAAITSRVRPNYLEASAGSHLLQGNKPKEHTQIASQQQQQDRKTTNMEQKQQQQLPSDDTSESSTLASRRNSYQQLQQHQQLPSTNRLISEHQARQQQALFRALTERQKLLDEMGAERPYNEDLMSASSWFKLSHEQAAAAAAVASLATENGRQAKAKTKRACSRTCKSRQTKACESQRRNSNNNNINKTDGVPLSKVDLSLVSDRELDELACRLASASSSSSSCESSVVGSASEDFSSSASVSSSSCSSSSSDQDEGCDSGQRRAVAKHHHQKHRKLRKRPSCNETNDNDQQASCCSDDGSQQLSSEAECCATSRRSQAASAPRRSYQDWLPNVIGVHEDPAYGDLGGGQQAVEAGYHNRRGQHQARPQPNCRETFRSRRSNGRNSDDDEHPDDRSRNNRDELSVRTSGESPSQWLDSLSPASTNFYRGQQQQQYHHHQNHYSHQDSNLSPFEPSSLAGTEQSSSMPQATVEQVLMGMLGALQDMQQVDGQAEPERARRAELLERGFSHLEQLLNCSLTPGTAAASAGAAATAAAAASGQSAVSLGQTAASRAGLRPPAGKATASSPQIAGSNGASLLSSTLSKDSDYGSDTQSADCFSHYTAGSSDASAFNFANQLAANKSPSPVFRSQSDSPAASQRAPLGPRAGATSAQGPQQQLHQQLTPVAAELAVKIDGLLRQLREQSQPQDQHQREQEQPAGNATGATHLQPDQPDAGLRQEGSPRQQNRGGKSVVLMNQRGVSASPSPSPSSSWLEARQLIGDNEAMAESQDLKCNSKPADEDQISPTTQRRRQQFKTRISINSSGQTSLLNDHHQQQQQENQQQPPLDVRFGTTTSVFLRRRSSRLRRRPSFGAGNKGGGGGGGTTTSRPGSPIPKFEILQDVKPESSTEFVSSEAACETQDQEQEDCKHQDQAEMRRRQAGEAGADGKPDPEQQVKSRQLQRMLELGQKYNYSPAKLATAKLGSKLQLSSTSAAEVGQANDATDLWPSDKGSLQNNNNNNRSKLAKSNHREPRRPADVAQDSRQQVLLQQQTLAREREFAGKVELEISYLAKNGSLIVHVIRCTQLRPVGKRQKTANPYVKLYLLPDRSPAGKRRSRVLKADQAPKFDEQFHFGPIELAQFESRHLWLSVWHHQGALSASNELLGELLLPLSQVRQQLLASDLCHSTSAIWYPLSFKPKAPSAKKTNSHHSQQIDRPDSVDSRQQQQQQHQMELKLTELHQKASKLASISSAVAAAGSQAAVPITEASLAGQQQQTAKSISRENQRQQQQHEQHVSSSLQRSASGSHKSADFAPEANRASFRLVLGPEPEIGDSQPAISGKLFVAIKFVPDDNVAVRYLTTKRHERGARVCEMLGDLHVNIKEAYGIAGFEPPRANSIASTDSAGLPLNSCQPQQLGQQQSALANLTLPNPYCKCSFFDSDGSRISKQKTPAEKKTANPRWNHTCKFKSVQFGSLMHQGIEIRLNSNDSILVSDEFLGGIRLCHAFPETRSQSKQSPISSLGADSESANNSLTNTIDSSGSLKLSAFDDIEPGAICSARESKLWVNMLEKPNIWAYGELPLRNLRPLVLSGSKIGSSRYTNNNNNSNTANQSAVEF